MNYKSIDSNLSSKKLLAAWSSGAEHRLNDDYDRKIYG